MASNANARTGLAIARLAYLYGTGNDGTPLRVQAPLLAMAMVDRQTLRNHIKVWDKEAETMAREASSSLLAFTLPEATVEAHRHDVDWLRMQLDCVKEEVDEAEKIAAGLLSLIEGMQDNVVLGSDDYAAVLGMVSRYLNVDGVREGKRKQFLALRSAWESASGMAGTIAAYSAQLRETAKLKAKQASGGVAPEDATPPDAGAKARQSGVFKRGE